MNSPARQQKLDQLLADYLSRSAAGNPPDREAWLAEHADLAPELASFLDAHQQLKSHILEQQEDGPDGGGETDDYGLVVDLELAEDELDAPTLRPPSGGHRASLREAATLPPDGSQSGEEESIVTASLVDERVFDDAVIGGGKRVRYFGDYELIEEIARGGMGVVFKARQSTLNRTVALKMILAGELASEDEVKRFHAEAEAAAKLDHPGIVPIYEVGEHRGQHYFSMAYVDGSSLAERMREGPLAAQDAAAIVRQMCDAVAYAHEHGVIHRDLKPGNVLVDGSGVAKVTDFGLAKQVRGDSDLTATGQILGTPSYMPPEQASGKRGTVDERSDVYSLGAVLYALVAGRPPFQADNPLDTIFQVLSQEAVPLHVLNAKISRDLENICAKCLQKDPKHRYPTAQALGSDLAAFMEGRPVQARPLRRTARAWRWCKRRPAVAALLAGLILSLSAGTFISARLAAQSRDRAEMYRRQLVRAEWLLYGNQLSSTERELELGRVDAAVRTLNSTTASYRGWEYEYLHARARSRGMLLGLFPDYRALIVSPDENVLVGLGTHEEVYPIDPVKERARWWNWWEAEPLTRETDVVAIHIRFAAQSRDRNLVAIAGVQGVEPLATGVVQLVHASSGEEIARHVDVDSTPTAICFSPDEQQYAVASTAHTLEIRGVDASRPVIRLSIDDRATSMSWSPDGRWLAIGYENGSVDLIRTGAWIRTLTWQPHDGRIAALEFVSDSSRLISAGADEVCCTPVYSTVEQFSTPISADWRGDHPQIQTLALVPGTSEVVSGGLDGFLRIWNGEDGSLVRSLEADAYGVQDVLHNPYDGWLYTVSGRGDIRFWGLNDELRIGLEFTSPVGVGIAEGTDGGLVYSLSDEGLLEAYSSQGSRVSGQPVPASLYEELEEPLPGAPPANIVFSPTGEWVLLPERNTFLLMHLTNTEDSRTIQLPAVSFQGPILNCAAFFPDGRRFVVGGEGGGYVHHVDREDWLYDIPSVSLATDVAVSPQGRYLAIADFHTEVTVLDASTGDVRWKKPRKGSASICFVDDGRQLVIASDADQTLEFFSSSTGKLLQSMRVSQPVARLAAHPDGARLVVGGKQGGLFLVSVAGAVELLSFPPHRNAVHALAFMNDGRTLASVARSGRASVFSLPDVTQRATLPQAGGLAVKPTAVETAREAVALYDRFRSRVAATRLLDASPETLDEAPAPEQWPRRQLTAWLSGHDPSLAEMHRIAQQRPGIVDLDVSVNGEQVIAADAEGIIRIFDQELDVSTTELSASAVRIQLNPGTPRFMEVSPCGRWLAYGVDREILLVDMENDRPHARLIHPEADSDQAPVGEFGLPTPGVLDATQLRGGAPSPIVFQKLSWSEDGKRLAVSTTGGVMVWEPETGELVQTLSPEQLTGYHVALSPDGDRVAFTTQLTPQVINVYEVDTGRLVYQQPLTDNRMRLQHMEWDSSNRWIVSLRDDRRLEFLNAADGTLHAVTPETSSTSIRVVDLDVKGNYAAVAWSDGRVGIWHLPSGEFMKDHQLTESTIVAADLVRLDDRLTVVVSDQRNVWLWTDFLEGRAGRVSHRPLPPLSGTGTARVVLHPGRHEIVRVQGRRGQVIPLQQSEESGRPLAFDMPVATDESPVTDSHGDPVRDHVRFVAALTDSGLAAGGFNCQLWNLRRPTMPTRRLVGNRFGSVVASRDGTVVVTLHASEVQIRDVRGEVTQRWQPREFIPGVPLHISLPLAIDDAARTIAVAHHGEVDIHERDGTLRSAFECTAAISTMALSPDGERCIVALNSGRLQVWDAAAGTLIEESELGGEHISNIVFDPTGSRWITGGEHGVIRLWDAGTLELIDEWLGHRDAITALAIDAAGHRLYSGDGRGEILAWDLGEPESPVNAPPAMTQLVPLGENRLLGTDVDGNLHRWSLVDADWEPTMGPDDAVDGGDPDPALQLVRSGDDQTVAVRYADRVEVFDAASDDPQPERTVEHPGVSHAAFTDGSDVLVTVDPMGMARRWTQDEEGDGDPFAVGEVVLLAGHPELARCAVGRPDGAVAVVDIATGEVLQEFPGDVVPTAMSWIEVQGAWRLMVVREGGLESYAADGSALPSGGDAPMAIARLEPVAGTSWMFGRLQDGRVGVVDGAHASWCYALPDSEDVTAFAVASDGAWMAVADEGGVAHVALP